MSVLGGDKISSDDLVFQKKSEMDDIGIIINMCIDRLTLIGDLESNSATNMHIHRTFIFLEIMDLENKKDSTQGSSLELANVVLYEIAIVNRANSSLGHYKSPD